MREHSASEGPDRPSSCDFDAPARATIATIELAHPRHSEATPNPNECQALAIRPSTKTMKLALFKVCEGGALASAAGLESGMPADETIVSESRPRPRRVRRLQRRPSVEQFAIRIQRDEQRFVAAGGSWDAFGERAHQPGAGGSWVGTDGDAQGLA
jgi:hypothetical protein